jgi:hypothetical protein
MFISVPFLVEIGRSFVGLHAQLTADCFASHPGLLNHHLFPDDGMRLGFGQAGSYVGSV